MRCVGFMWMLVTELCIPPRVFDVSDFGTPTWRSIAWYIIDIPSGTRCDTTARAATTPLPLTISTQSLSETPIFAASTGLIQRTGPPRNSVSIWRLSGWVEWMDHFEAGVM